MLVSYAQNFEDLVLDRVFHDQESGFYVDVGAGDPVRASVTHLFYERGWRGINIEPDRSLFEPLAAARARDVNLNIAAGERAETRRFFEVSVPGLSSLDAECAALAVQHGAVATEAEVAVETLAEICRRHADAPIDFLKVDVEGWERQVLASHDWRRFRPRLVVVEATQPNTTVPSHEAWERHLLDQGYLFASFDGLNRFYVEATHGDLVPILAAPPRFLADGAILHREIMMLRRAEASEQTAELLAQRGGEAERVRQAAEVRAEAAVQRAAASERRAVAAEQAYQTWERRAVAAEQAYQAWERRAVAAEQAYQAWARSRIGRLAHFLRLHRRRDL